MVLKIGDWLRVDWGNRVQLRQIWSQICSLFELYLQLFSLKQYLVTWTVFCVQTGSLLVGFQYFFCLFLVCHWRIIIDVMVSLGHFTVKTGCIFVNFAKIGAKEWRIFCNFWTHQGQILVLFLGWKLLALQKIKTVRCDAHISSPIRHRGGSWGRWRFGFTWKKYRLNLFLLIETLGCQAVKSRNISRILIYRKERWFTRGANLVFCRWLVP